MTNEIQKLISKREDYTVGTRSPWFAKEIIQDLKHLKETQQESVEIKRKDVQGGYVHLGYKCVCGSGVIDGAVYCRGCGVKLKRVE